MSFFGKDNLNVKMSLNVKGKSYQYFSINEAAKQLGKDLSRLPFSLKVLFENLLRFENDQTVKVSDIKAFADWIDNKKSDHEIAFTPARVLMQDFTGVPAVVDLAAMRDAVSKLGGDPQKINPLSPVDLVIDHSVQVDKAGNSNAFRENVDLEMQRNAERYEFLRWGQEAFTNFRVVPPGTGICHQVNLEYLAQVVWTRQDDGHAYAFPDTLVGTDSHTTMVNGLGVLGWGVGGIEAEAAMLGQAMSMLIPEVIGFKFIGSLKEGTTATDLVLTVTQMLRKKGVVNKFVEFYGSGLSSLALADRATIANMAPEYGATCGFFAVDDETIKYLKLTARDEDRIELVKEYCKAQGLWRDENTPDPLFTDTLELDLATVEPSLAGPKRPQDKVLLSKATTEFVNILPTIATGNKTTEKFAEVSGQSYKLANGDVVIAAITSCTNTSNPYVMVAAGLVAKKAAERGLTSQPWVKASLAPGSQVVSEYLNNSGLQTYLDKIGFNVVGYGCTTCIGNSGPLKAEIEEAISKNDLQAVSVLSGNRNFEGRVHALCKANYLASPPLVVIYALAGSMNIDVYKDAIAKDKDGKDVFLKDLWPTSQEVRDVVEKTVTADLFKTKYKDVFSGDEVWKKINVKKSQIYNWNAKSTYIQNPPYFEGMKKEIGKIEDVKGATLLAKLGDSITTDHISPAGSISKTSPAAKYLTENGVEKADFNSYGSRRGNHEIMMRGTFANIRIKNEIAPGTEGGFTTYIPTGEVLPIYDAAMKYKQTNTPLVIVAGKEYGTGSSRDWAAKGTLLLGVKAVIAESFERIHRSNLVRMGVLPFVFKDGMTRNDLNLKGDEKFDIVGLSNDMAPLMDVKCTITRKDGSTQQITLMSRVDTVDEVIYLKNGGILQYVIRQII